MQRNQQRSSRSPRLALRLAITCGAGLLGIGLVELALRIFDIGPPPRVEREGGLFRPSSVSGLGFENRPGARQRLSYRERRGAEPEVIVMRVNEQGFRGAPLEPQGEPGVLRIACVGDSHTFGWGVPEGASWPDRLALELSRRHPEREVEVMNAGVNNYDTVQEVLWLEARVLPYEPDLVVLQFFVNDAAVHGAERARPFVADGVLAWTDPARGGWVGALRSHSRFAELACDWAYRRRGLAVYSARRTRLFDEAEPGWQQVRGALTRARDLLAARGIAFVVALYPFMLREGEHLTSHAAFELVQRFCAEESIACIDTEPAFLGEDVDLLRISPDDYHANARAHELFAAAVADGLEARALLIPSGRR